MLRCSSLFALLLLLASCAQTELPTKQEAQPWKKVPFSSFSSWRETLASGAVPALARNCSLIEKKGAKDLYAGLPAKEWKASCSALENLPQHDEAAAHAYIEQFFSLYTYSQNSEPFFTAYYEPLIEASRTKEGPYQTPLYKKPTDMLTADLGLFDPALKGKKITGKVKGSAFIPYDDRASVSKQGLEGRAEPLLYVKNPVDAFFLEIQGSGLASLPSGEILRVAYDGQNGRPYAAIGKIMADKGLIEKPVTMQKIKAWLHQNPGQSQSILDQNPSYVFFRLGDSSGAKGAQSVPLTPGHSLAIDPSFLPLGSVILAAPTSLTPRIMVAQDTGGAIKGPLRGDVFMGSGLESEKIAGSLQDGGSFYLLWPRTASHAPGF